MYIPTYTSQKLIQVRWIAVRSAISDFDRPVVTTVGALVAAEVVSRPDVVALVAEATGVLGVADDAGSDTGAEPELGSEVRVVAVVPAVGLTVPAVGLTGPATDEDAAVGVVVSTDTDVPLSDAADDAVLTLDGAAVRVVGPAPLDVQELSRTAATDQPASRPLRPLFTIRPPAVVLLRIPASTRPEVVRPHSRAHFPDPLITRQSQKATVETR